MSVPAAYLVVVLVWSTTPLGIQWSAEGLSPAAGAMSRMCLAALIAWLVARLIGVSIPWHREAVRVYGFSNIGLFAGLMCVYLGATYIPSGMISVVFGFSPLASALMSRYLLDEPAFGWIKWLAIAVGIMGLMVTFYEDLSLSGNGLLGFALVAAGMLCFSLSNVLIKRENTVLHPFAQSAGSMILAAPLYAISGWMLGLEVDSPPPRAIMAILYLTVFGSFIGYFCYFYILKHLAASTVTLVTLITPVIAISLGVALNGEHLSANILVGAGMIVSCLLLFYWGDSLNTELIDVR